MAKKITDMMCAEIVSRAFAGVTFAKIASEIRTNKEALINRLDLYEPYASWVLACRTNPAQRMDEIRELMSKGIHTRHIAELLQMTYDGLLQEIHKLELADGKVYLTSSEASEVKKHITVYDVERFKRMVQVGESLVYDMTEDGVLRYCTIQKKCKHFAMTDVGCVQWNWLTVKNERRLISDEIVYGR